MIRYIKGNIIDRDDDGKLTVMPIGQGIGYSMFVSDLDRDTLSRRGIGGDVELHVHAITQESESQLILFGFIEHDDLQAFTRIIKTNGIGPSSALKALSCMHAIEAEAMTTQELETKLKAAKGIGGVLANKLASAIKKRVVK